MRICRTPTPSLARRARAIGWAIACAAALLAIHPALAFDLITPAEAALPPGKIPSFEVRGSPTRLPNIAVVSPSGAGVVYSPLELKLRFTAFGGAAIDPDSVVVTYIKQPDLDITARLKQFITAIGIDITQAQVPPGLHQFWIELKDTDGRVNGREFEFQVTQ